MRRAKSKATYSQKVTQNKKDEDIDAQQFRRFEEACAVMRENAKKFVGDNAEYKSSDSEDDLEDKNILDKTLENYRENGTIDIQKTREFLQECLTSGALVCLICIESIKRNDQIWSCESCYCMLHLPCIQKWAKDSMYHQTLSEDGDKNRDSLTWSCPKCRCAYKAHEKPKNYYCFCGKTENLVFDPWTIPHSCGQTCNKNLKPLCGHICTLLCHPGPCPPCPKTIEVSCYCQKSQPLPRRCSSKNWSCGQRCNKLLFCKQHHCENSCHEGECTNCKKQSKQKCQCGTETKLRPCDDLIWKCETECVKQLECGNHLCLTKCHKGPCPPCPNSGPRPCPCNKKVMRLPCTEEVAPCGDTCDKLLECEIHQCSQRCHFGSCGKCLQMRVMKCRCEQRIKSVPCCKEYVCDTKCKRRRDCGKHNCNRKCCTGNCPPCEAPCKRTLNCGNHKCSSRCHSGPCFPCRETMDVKCNCGSTKITVPCGRKKNSVQPRCLMDCKLPADCHHQQRHKHRCHFGTCPPCRLKCNKELSCGHVCPAKCHSAVLTKVETKQKKEGPWDLVNSYKLEHVCKPCSPCVVPVTVRCLGGHETREFPCKEAKSRSCGRKCDRKLSCSNHTCQLECHEVDHNMNLEEQAEKCQPCDEICSKPRKLGCFHPCNRPCHPGDCVPCSQSIKFKCHCQITVLYIPCQDWCDAGEDARGEKLSCKNNCPKEISCGHRCSFLCHKGPCSSRENCKKKVAIRCPCKRLKKDLPCFTRIENPNLKCDEECFRLIESKRAQELEDMEQKRKEAEKQQEEEVKEFLRKSEGRRKKKKKIQEVKEDEGWSKQHYIVISASICILAMFIIAFVHLHYFEFLKFW